MEESDFPALYLASDQASRRCQVHFVRSYRINALLLILASLLGLVSAHTHVFAIVSSCLLGASLGFYVFCQSRDFQGRWYRARALAESVKTATWRLMMRSEPFSSDLIEKDLDKFRTLLAELLDENRGMGADLNPGIATQEQITEKMHSILDAPFEVKRELYLRHRIQDQRDWYVKKSGENRDASTVCFTWVCLAYVAALVLSLIRIASPDLYFLPIDFLVVVASSLIGWKQLKRYDELASSYGLTAHEIGIIVSRYKAVATADHLSSFVRDAENAFSREHTQWAARRDAS